MNPISKTAYYTLAVRAWDATLPKPACGDSFAHVFMNEEAQKTWLEFQNETRANPSNASRHAIIDNYLRDVLSTTPDPLIVIIGAGFDTRAFRLNSGNWIEVDEPAILNYKDSKLPSSSAPNSLKRIPIEFATESLTRKLASFTTPRITHIIIEGVLMYLKEEQRQDLIASLHHLFPNQVVYCDLMRKSFFESYGKKLHEKIVALGTSFQEMSEYPEDLFLKNGYRTLSCTSIPLYAAEYGNLKMPSFLIKYFLKKLRDGYSIWRFEKWPRRNEEHKN